jgi:CheY-like chemotaxis protein
MPDTRQILLVDDDHTIVGALNLRLEALGYDLITASNGKQGLESAIENQPDLIVTDIRMPEMDGLTMLTMLRQREETQEIPVIVVSASLVDRKHALTLGARYFLQKPYDSQLLKTAINSILAERILSEVDQP